MSRAVFGEGLLKKATFGPAFGNNGSDLLVLDLDGDGFELTNRTSASPFFDIDNDGYLGRTAFAKGDDGVLARDLNGDGAVMAADAFSSLLVWCDLDRDARSDAGEL